MTVGASVRRFDGPSKVDGSALYPGDIPLDNPLHAKVVFSNKPHAKMLSMDVTPALAMPGVVTIITAADVPTTADDYVQLVPMMVQAEEMTGSTATMCAEHQGSPRVPTAVPRARRSEVELERICDNDHARRIAPT